MIKSVKKESHEPPPPPFSTVCPGATSSDHLQSSTEGFCNFGQISPVMAAWQFLVETIITNYILILELWAYSKQRQLIQRYSPQEMCQTAAENPKHSQQIFICTQVTTWATWPNKDENFHQFTVLSSLTHLVLWVLLVWFIFQISLLKKKEQYSEKKNSPCSTSMTCEKSAP